MESTTESTLSSLGYRALRNFITLIEHSRDEIVLHAQYQRLKLWSGSLGLLGAHRASLDHRLRNAVLVRDVVWDLLSDLVRVTAALLEIYTGVRLPYDQDDRTDHMEHSDQHSRHSTQHDSDSSDDSEESSDVDDHVHQIPSVIPSEIETRLSEIVDIVDKLFRFAIDVRNSATRSGPGDRNPFRKFSVEKQQQIYNDLGRFEEFLITRHLAQVRGSIDHDVAQVDEDELEPLIRRCGRANVLRRQYISMWRDRKDEEQGHVNHITDINLPAETSTQPLTVMNTRATAASVANTSKQKSILAPSVEQTVTTIDPAKVRRVGGTSNYSRGTRSAPSVGPKGGKPPWPSSLPRPQGEYFECPYCFFICPSKYRENDETWRNHVASDIRPYICTYAACESADQLYQSRSDWKDHESNAHRKIWRCPDHPSQEMTLQQYLTHTRHKHTKYQAEMRTVEALRAAESTPTTYERPCPFCGSTFDSSDDLETHLAYHLECIALLTLPAVDGIQGQVPDSDFDSNSVLHGDDSRFEDSDLDPWLPEDNTDSQAVPKDDQLRPEQDISGPLERHLAPKQSGFASGAVTADLTSKWVSSEKVTESELDQTPWYLQLERENEVVYDRKFDPPQITGGTLSGLVEQLTRHDKLDPTFNSAFLLTYTTFTTAADVFSSLSVRFDVAAPSGLSKKQHSLWTENMKKPIRFRVVNILRSWFETYWMEEANEATQKLLDAALDFSEKAFAIDKIPGALKLSDVIRKRLVNQEPTASKLVLRPQQSPPSPILPKNLKKMKLLDLDPLELARQLTIMESKAFAAIKPKDCLEKSWTKKSGGDEFESGASIKHVIAFSNSLTNFVADIILAQVEVKKRVGLITQFVKIAENCHKLNNFSSLTAIMSALSSSPIYRLSRTWARLLPRTRAFLDSMRQITNIDKNFQRYREALQLAISPCCPFLGVYLLDLTFINDGIPAFIKDTELINFKKCRRIAEVIQDLQQYQHVPYNLTPVPEIQSWLTYAMGKAQDAAELYRRSLEVEPRERDEERIATLLSEPGFL